ncbi:hypothetical protein MTR_6g011110 [Medicago truncatula]|nr:hypothetical protein MTR_6g011110 [Medicago truncatula]
MINKFFRFAYHGSSSGYLIMTGKDNSFILINPFTRRKMVINNSVFEVDFSCFACKVLLAFCRGSEEFVLLVLCRDSNDLHVYQSRSFSWVTYLTPQKVVDFVVLQSTIYVVTNKANIGIVNLNSTNINFLELKTTIQVHFVSYAHVGLVSCDGHLLVLHIMSKVTFNVYKIDFSTMDYVKLKTLGDIALFYAPQRKYYALSNPRMWGYENNSVYVIDVACEKYTLFKGDVDKLPELILPIVLIAQYPPLHPGPQPKQPYLDWCFRHIRNKVDYSLVE